MKKTFIFLISLVLLQNCTGCDDDDKTIDISVLPEETTTGANTFGCVIDGWVYVGGRYYHPYYNDYHDTVYTHHHEDVHSILFCYYPELDRIKVTAWVERDYNLSFVINNPEEGKECILTDVYFRDSELPDGTAYITMFNKGYKQFISGRFECGNIIKHGRFDALYHK
ncbi:MAG: hypothetical protein LBT56_05075 [Prevotellaceae bacterium]|jgi:hypothetical protein|nr:hypothetical protein [Prevotellaceae bacterium]